MERNVIKNYVIPLEIVHKYEGIHKDDFWSYILSLQAIQTSSESMKRVAPYEGTLRQMGWVNVTDYKNEMGRGVPQLKEFEETGEAMIVMLRSAVRSLESSCNTRPTHLLLRNPKTVHCEREHLSVTYVVTCDNEYPRYPHPNDAVFVRWKNPGPQNMTLAIRQHIYAQSVYSVSSTVWGSDENIRHMHLGFPRYWDSPNDEDG